MSFSSDVKKELAAVMPGARHCEIAELAAIISLTGRIEINAKGGYILWIHTENPYVADTFYRLVKDVSSCGCDVCSRLSTRKKSMSYTVVLSDSDAVIWILSALKYIGPDGNINDDFSLVSESVIQLSCCKKAFIRGAFLASGSLGDPKKAYHFEIVTESQEKAEALVSVFEGIGLKARSTKRKNHYLTYLKEGDEIVDVLGCMEAPVSLMELENIRILKDVRNEVNRRVNCETANIEKTAKASARQLSDIEYISETKGLDWLSEGLQDVARTRLAYPDATLSELGKKLQVPLGKSGVNHRLTKISSIAEDLRGGK